MLIEVKFQLKGPLKRYLWDKDQARIKLNEGSTVADLLAAYNLPDRSTGMIAVNGKKERSQVVLVDGDCVIVYPPVSGG